MSRASAVTLVALAGLVAGAAGVLAVGGQGPGGRGPGAEAFQHLVGGLGFGPALDLSPAAAFDPRLDGSRAAGDALVPGGEELGPQSSLSIFYYPPLDRRPGRAGGPDAPPP
jgi:hypothetical protein